AQALGAVKPTEAADQIGGATVAANHRTVEDAPKETCQKVDLARDYYLPASDKMFDWTPTSAPAWRLTLIESLKALVGAAAVVGSGLVCGLVGPLFGPLVTAGLAGGLTAIATAGIPAS